jgi:hypothetical protein
MARLTDTRLSSSSSTDSNSDSNSDSKSGTTGNGPRNPTKPEKRG